MVSANGARRASRRGGVVRDPVITESAFVEGAAPGAGTARTVGPVVDAGSLDTSPPALSLLGLSKTFGAQRALENVDLTIRRGGIHALVGQNGSGKSTLVKILAGYHDPDAGAQAEVAGRTLALGSAAAAKAAGLRFVHQDLGLVEPMTVADNFRMDRGGVALAPVHRRSEHAQARHALEKLGYDISPTTVVASLVESERTAVALARALADVADVPLLVLDEPTASLPRPEAERLFAAIRRVAAAGTAVLFISHHLDEVLRLADHVTVLRDGFRVATTHVGDLSQHLLIEMMLGRQLLDATALRDRVDTDDEEPPRIIARGLGGHTVAGIDLHVRGGEVLGIAGLTGSGREEVASLVAGRLPRAGTVAIDGKAVPPGDPRAAIVAGVAFVPADRERALLGRASVRENVTLANLAPFW